MSGLLESAMDNISAQQIVPEDCTLEDDGLLYCRKCGEPRQFQFTVFGKMRTEYVMCRCQKAADEEERLKFKTNLSNEEIARMRNIALPSDERRSHTFAADNHSQPKMAQCRKYANDFENNYKRGAGILMYGACGTGKSYAADAIANKVIDLGYSALITNFGEIAKNVSGVGYDDRAIYYAGLTKYALLVIDDMGVEKETDFMLELIHRVVDERVKSGKPMIISTNFSPERIKCPPNDEWARIMSRITLVCYPMLFEGEDMRKLDATKNYRKMKAYFESASDEI